MKSIEQISRDPGGRETLLTAAQVAAWLGVSRQWVYDHSSGRRLPLLPSIQLGRSRRFRPSEVLEFLEMLKQAQGNGSWSVQ